jgi:hypothetical protein
LKRELAIETLGRWVLDLLVYGLIEGSGRDVGSALDDVIEKG